VCFLPFLLEDEDEEEDEGGISTISGPCSLTIGVGPLVLELQAMAFLARAAAGRRVEVEARVWGMR